MTTLQCEPNSHVWAVERADDSDTFIWDKKCRCGEEERQTKTDVFCNCSLWMPEIEKINNMQSFCLTHGLVYALEWFRFCPWCGDQLVVGDDS